MVKFQGGSEQEEDGGGDDAATALTEMTLVSVNMKVDLKAM